MKFPENLRYTKDHEWVKLKGDTAIVGITSSLDIVKEKLLDETNVFRKLFGVSKKRESSSEKDKTKDSVHYPVHEKKK